MDPVKICERCGEEYRKRKGKTRESLKGFAKRRFCSKDCRIEWQREWYTTDNPMKYYDNSGKNNPMYGKKGWNYDPEGSRRKDGYYRVTVNGKRMLKHRYILEQHLGRELKSGEVVHHIDHNPSNNELENLMLFSSHSEHVKYEQCQKSKSHIHPDGGH